MIARDLRLRLAGDFERVRAQGRSCASRTVVAVVLPNELGRNRYGFAAGRRLGNAVQRNRAKRLMREAVRGLHPRLAQGFDVVFIARNALRPDTPYADVAADVEQVLRRAGLYEGPRAEG